MNTLAPDISFESESLLFRKVSESDIPFVFSASRHPNFCDGMRWEPPESENELIHPLRSNLEAWEAGTAYTFTLFLRNDLSRVGRISIRHQSDTTWDLGFWTHPEYQNRGFMTEACRRMLLFGFSELRASSIVASHATWNHASRRVLQNIGMTFSENFPNAWMKSGIPVSADIRQIARDEWNVMTEQGATANPYPRHR